MKATVYSIDGKKKGDVEMPKAFGVKIREDVAAKYFEAYKFIQPYSHDPEGGRKASASGTISHKRHDWKGHYGKGISRAPRKTMWRRGTQFYWIGAEVSGARGGRRVHGPKGVGKEKKINKREIELAMHSGFAASVNNDFIVRRYGKIEELKVKLPIVIESGIEKAKTKEVMGMLKGIFGDIFESAILKKREVRAGKGKTRGRKYKSNAGLLFVKASEEKIKINGVDVKSVEDVTILDLYPLGRITVYTEKAIKELNDSGEKK